VVTRDAGTSFFGVTPLARVPVLQDGDITIADTRDICGHFDQVTDRKRWLVPETPQTRLDRNIATGFLDGVAVWLRENARPESARSAQVMQYEQFRAKNAMRWFETREIHTRFDFSALTLVCALDIATSRGMGNWANIAPQVCEWATAQAKRNAFWQTRPGPA